MKAAGVVVLSMLTMIVLAEAGFFGHGLFIVLAGPLLLRKR